MNTKKIKTIFYYGMVVLVGTIFAILGAIFKNYDIIFHKMFRVGFELIAVGIVFLLITLKVQSNEKNDRALQQFNNTISDERNQFIAGKSASITTDIMLVFSILTCTILSFFGMNNYAYIIIGYTLINSIFQIGFSIYFRHKF